MEKPLRVMQMAPLRMGGITEMVLNIAENVDRTKVVFDYLTFIDTFENARLRAENAGGVVYRVDLQSIQNPVWRGIKKFFGIVKLVKKQNFNIIYINTSTPYEVLVAFAAKMGGAKKIVLHSHNSSYYPGQKLTKVSCVFKALMPLFVTHYIACSEDAANFMFPKKVIEQHKYIILKNGINVDKFRFDTDVREEYRSKFKLNDCFVIGNVSRFNVQKNHEFLIDIFAEVYKRDNSARLFLVGGGETEDAVRRKVHGMSLDDVVTFHGLSKEVNKLLQMMDVFVMPSLYEGLPVAGVEVQASGLPIVISDTVTKELQITDNVEYLPLNAGEGIWAARILQYKTYIRRDTSALIKKSGFDIRQTVKILSNLFRTR